MENRVSHSSRNHYYYYRCILDNSIKSFVYPDQGYTPVGTSQRQRQEFLLDVLLQVQKPLVNNQLVQLGQELVTDPNMYLLVSF